MNAESQLSANVLDAIHANHKIVAIKLLHELRDLGLQEAKYIVEAYARENPHLIRSRNSGTESGAGRVALVVIIIVAAYGAYRFFT